MMEHKGYTGVVEVDDVAGILFGRVLGLRDVITFQGETVGGARRAFEDSVDDYLEFCAERGEAPEKPCSGKFVVRVDPTLHRAIATRAEALGISLNAAAQQAFQGFVSAVPLFAADLHVSPGDSKPEAPRGTRPQKRAGKHQS